MAACSSSMSSLLWPKYGTAKASSHIFLLILTSLSSTSYISPSILPNLPLPWLCKWIVLPIGHKANRNALDSKPLAFSSLSLVRDSGVSIPCNLTRCLANTTENPRSMSTSIVSPSITLTTLTLYWYITLSHFLCHRGPRVASGFHYVLRGSFPMLHKHKSLFWNHHERLFGWTQIYTKSPEG